MQGKISLCLAGASPDTGNNGVSALCQATVQALSRQLSCAFTILGYNRGVISGVLPGENGREISFRQAGAYNTRRFYRRESWAQIDLLSRLPLAWRFNHVLRVLHGCAAVLDLGAGDSFSDIYGARRFAEIMYNKAVPLRMGLPLVLMPQTYGPYYTAQHRARAASVVKRATIAIARDEDSFGILQNLLGADFSPDRHLCGVDMAFGLIPQQAQLPPGVVGLFGMGRPLAGLNVSGLIFKGGGTRCPDYAQAVLRVAEGVLRDGAALLLVPHVRAPQGHPESDLDACLAIKGELAAYGNRVAVLPETYGPGQIKGIIGQLDWFCGTRMHSTIAALSSGVVSAALAYSDKTAGVFASCGLRQAVADARVQTPEQSSAQILEIWREREILRPVLLRRLDGVMSVHRAQVRKVCDLLETLHHGGHPL